MQQPCTPRHTAYGTIDNPPTVLERGPGRVDDCCKPRHVQAKGGDVNTEEETLVVVEVMQHVVEGFAEG